MFPETARILRERFDREDLYGRHILNLGSGTTEFFTLSQPWIYGDFLIYFAGKPGLTVIHVDEKPAGCALSEFVQIRGSAENVPLGDWSVDFVLCTSLLEHVEDPKRVIAEAARLLRPFPQNRAFFEVPFEYPNHPDPIDTGLRIGTEAEWAALLGHSWKIEKFWHIVSASRPGSCSMVEVVRA